MTYALHFNLIKHNKIQVSLCIEMSEFLFKQQMYGTGLTPKQVAFKINVIFFSFIGYLTEVAIAYSSEMKTAKWASNILLMLCEKYV